MSESRLPAFEATSAVIPAVIRFEAGLVRSIAPMENWVILASELVGVQEVSAIELTQMTVRTMTSGSERSARPTGTPKKMMGEPGAEHAEERDADIRNPKRQLDARQDVLALRFLFLFATQVFEEAGENFRFADEGNQRADHHHGHAPPERPLIDDLGAAERDRRAVGSDARSDVAARDHDGREHEKVHGRAENHAGRDAHAH